MFVDTSKSGRKDLSTEEKIFFQHAVALAVYISAQTAGKAKWLKHFANPVGIKPSIVIADILYGSQLGNHPVSQKRCGNKPANNLALIEPGKYWYGTVLYYKGKEFRSYKDREAFAVDMSDWIALSGLFDKVITEDDFDKQLRGYAINRRNPNKFHAILGEYIEMYSLREFDTWPERKKQMQRV